MATKKTSSSKPKHTVAQKSNLPEKQLPAKNSLKLTRNQIYILVGVVVLIVAAILIKNRFLVARVNGQYITRPQYVSELEKQAGKNVLDNLITQSLIEQEASKKHITVTDKDIATEMSKVETQVKQQGQDLDTLLASQNTTRDGLKQQLRTQLLVERLLGNQITVSDKEITQFMDQNKQYITNNANMAQVKAQVKEQLRQQKLNDKFQTWITSVRKNAKITYYITQ